MISALTFASLLATAHAATASLATDSSRVSVGVTVVTAAWGDDSEIQARLTVAYAGRCDRDADDYWGTDGNTPRTVVKRLFVTMGGDTVYVPHSSYVDLAEPSTIAIRHTPEAFSVVITGGDGSGSYSARFDISNLTLTKRFVESGEFPEEWEERTYSSIPNDGR
jgi:hypothetical protein